MAGNVANPRIWVNAEVYTAPLGTTAPTDVVTAWAAAWLDLGLLSEDGMTESRTEDTTDHYAWGGVLVRTTRSKHKRTFTVTCLEDNAVLFDVLNPGSTDVNSAGGAGQPPAGTVTRTVKVPTPDPRAFGFEMRDGAVTKRIIVPRGEIVAVGDSTASDASMHMKELTINVYPSSTGTLYTEITNDPQAVPAA